jgi:hypothetical protein
MAAIGLILGGILMHQSLAADPKQDKPDAFQPASVWQGVADPDPRWANRREHAAHLRVLERDGENFAAQILISEPGDQHAARLEGKIRNGELVAHITKIIKGDWGADAVDMIWNGKLEGENLLLTRTNQRHMNLSCRLKLEKGRRLEGR